MMFLINAQDTAGNVTLNRASVPAALKKAGELISDGCWNVEIVTPDGATYHPASSISCGSVPARRTLSGC